MSETHNHGIIMMKQKPTAVINGCSAHTLDTPLGSHTGWVPRSSYKARFVNKTWACGTHLRELEFRKYAICS